MKILLTGASSFSGYWFARALVDAGHIVVAPLRAESIERYADVRAHRVRELGEHVQVRYGIPFGSEKFLDLLGEGADLLCHHAAQVENYRSPDFDVVAALAANTANMRGVITAGKAAGLRGLLLTGSVFEQDEGSGENPRRAFSPYGLSKGLSFQVARYWAQTLRMPYAKFVIPNPFGPLEEPRFCAHLLRTWVAGETASVKTPTYVRDNIHVGLLARVYVQAAERLIARGESFSIGPSGYIETQGSFAQRFAKEIGQRLGLTCRLRLEEQTDFSEPVLRCNVDQVDTVDLGWDEVRAWDEAARYYDLTYVMRR